MKLIALIALTASVTVFAAESGGYKPESQVVSEIFTSKITRVFSAQDGDHRFVAYAVVWKEQEVIVVPYASTQDDYATGDTVRCEMRQAHRSPSSRTTGRMTFLLLGRPGDPQTMEILSPTPADERARLEAVAREVERRRALRDAALGNVEITPKLNNSTQPAPTRVAPRVSPGESK